MPRLAFIDVFPQTGFYDRPWEDSLSVDAVARTARRVCEAHSRGLRALALEAPRASYRLLPRQQQVAGALSVELLSDLRGHNVGILDIPPDAHQWEPQPRAAAVLDAIHQTAVLLGERLGWDLASLRRVRDEVAADGAQFVWECGWKKSPDRLARVRVRAQWTDDGFGRLSLHVEDRMGSRFSRPVISFPTPEGLKRAAGTLVWEQADVIRIVPTIPPFGALAGPADSVHVSDLVEQDPLLEIPAPGGAFAAPVPVTASWQEDAQDRLDHVYVSPGADARGTPKEVGRTIRKINGCIAPLLRDWLHEGGVRDLEWFYTFDQFASTRLRIHDERPTIRIFQQRTKADLSEPATCAEVVLDDLQRALDRLATKLGSGPAPRLPR